MVRKHSPYTRSRDKRTRPKTKAPNNGWVISELSRLVNVPVRTLRYYVEHDVIRPIERRGTATRYARRELLRLLGTLRLLSERERKLADIKRQLDALGNAELEVWIRQRPLSDAVSAALAADAAGQWPPPRLSEDASSVARSTGTASPVPATQLTQPAETWHRVELLPGLSLEWLANPSPEVSEATRTICALFAGSSKQTRA